MGEVIDDAITALGLDRVARIADRTAVEQADVSRTPIVMAGPDSAVALHDERLGYLAAMTTLTEGVNLPVRGVVLAEARYEGQDPNTRLLGPRLLTEITLSRRSRGGFQDLRTAAR